ncbi:zinc ribbon domain-containing protein [Lysobacter sp. BMK333-48F3]|uniref:zinc ribbon domain-containing protein n=1 Tax=Lysobacter sp. BMK333-48F3 TaxID=2867962 RepID=UPI001C8BCB2B|nr:zinc ribbon domain-containing protein [Lysobacter sp. BMK333-48F3]MBX9400991.1 zinc ribbon domain-containing protein [Lysobacter sp. BMK333-48F3]
MDNATVGKHPCPECGGDLQWNAAKQALACPYCGTVVPWSPAQEAQGTAVAELDLARALAEHPSEQRGYGDDAERREVQCRSCKAISVFVDGKVAQRCEFCGSPSIIAHESLGDAITPQSVLPFKISDGQVRDAIRKWYGTRWFAPNRLKTAALTDTLKGVYLPYWTFDAHVAARWYAEAGYYYYETESYTENGQRRTREVRKVRWEPASGALQHFFDDELVPGTVGVHAELLEQIGQFPTTTDLKAYSPEFVRGWLVERYQVDLRRASELNTESMQQQTRQLCANDVPGDTHRNLQVQADYSGRTFKHILVPVWLVSYTYGSRNFQVLANGYTGQIAGERPYSWVKIFFAVLAALIVAAIVFGLFGGQR